MQTKFNYNLFDADGTPIRFEFDAGDVDAERLDALVQGSKAKLLGLGYHMVMPDKAATQTRTARIIGGLWGSYKEGSDLCFHIYKEHEANNSGKYKQWTVYPEKFHLLPDHIMAKKPDSPDGAVMMAPDTQTAKRHRKWIDWNVTIKLTPKLNRDGEVVKKTDGYPEMEYAGVESANPHPAAPQPVERQPAHREPERPTRPAAARPTRRPEQPVATREDLLKAKRQVFHALGSTYFGDDWDKRRAVMVSAYGKASSNDLTSEELDEQVRSLEEATRDAIIGAAEMKLEDPDELSVICREHTNGVLSNLADVGGVALTHILKRLDDLPELASQD